MASCRYERASWQNVKQAVAFGITFLRATRNDLGYRISGMNSYNFQKLRLQCRHSLPSERQLGVREQSIGWSNLVKLFLSRDRRLSGGDNIIFFILFFFYEKP